MWNEKRDEKGNFQSRLGKSWNGGEVWNQEENKEKKRIKEEMRGLFEQVMTGSVGEKSCLSLQRKSYWVFTYMFTPRAKKGRVVRDFCQLPIFTTRWRN